MSASPSNPFSLINNRRNKTGACVTDDTITTALNQWLLHIVAAPPCKDGCVVCLADEDLRRAASKYLLNWGEKKYSDCNQVLVDWVRSAWCQGNGKNSKYVFALPIDTSGLEDAITIRTNQTICAEALCAMFGLGSRQWSSISSAAQTSAISKPHGHTGKMSNRKRKAEDPVITTLSRFLEEKEEEGEPIPTRIVREAVGETTIRDHDDRAIYLAMANAKRALYREYCERQGWEITTTHSGGIRKKWVGNGVESNNIVSWSTFHLFWASVFPDLKVSRKREDICNLCFIFATRNQRKYTPSDDDNFSCLSEVSRNTGSTVESGEYDIVRENVIDEDLRMDDDLLGVVIELEELELLAHHEKINTSNQLIKESVHHVTYDVCDKIIL